MSGQTYRLERLDAVLEAGRGWLVAHRRWKAVTLETTDAARWKAVWGTLEAAEERLAATIEELDQ